ncbi:MAG: YfjI family protein [Hydrogenophaga sp.]|uniref:YfjI family protein n=1 Tax=Hydrogenophaga sp. TaxID=1904254 RepID=UPI004035F625
MNQHSVPFYPVHEFPVEARKAIEQVQQNIKAPLALIGASVLSAMSAAAQGRVMVKLPIVGTARPATLYSLVVADSGERKSAVDAKIFEPLKKRDVMRGARYTERLSHYQIEYRLWHKIEADLIKKIVKLTGEGENTEDLRSRLTEHGKCQPVKPGIGTRLRQNLSTRSLLDDLDGEGKSLVILSDEGQIVLEGTLLKSSGYLNKAWEGGPIQMNRANGVRISADNVSITFSIMVQSSALQGHLRKQGDTPRGTGFWARFLITWPESTMGTRFLYDREPTWEKLNDFHANIEAMMGDFEEEDSGDSEVRVYELDEDARALWVDLVNETELLIQPLGPMSDIRDFASKACEIAVRIAALFHHFSQQTGRISRDTLQRAARIVHYHIHEFKNIFSDSREVPQVYADSASLENYLREQFQRNGGKPIPRTQVLKCGPVRPKERFDPAMQSLEYEQKVLSVPAPNRQRWIWPQANIFAHVVHGV